MNKHVEVDEFQRDFHPSISGFNAETPEEVAICLSYQNGYIGEMEAVHELMALDMDFFEAEEFLATYGAD